MGKAKRLSQCFFPFKLKAMNLILDLKIKGPVKLTKRVEIAHSFLQSVSDQFHMIIISLPM